MRQEHDSDDGAPPDRSACAVCARPLAVGAKFCDDCGTPTPAFEDTAPVWEPTADRDVDATGADRPADGPMAGELDPASPAVTPPTVPQPVAPPRHGEPPSVAPTAVAPPRHGEPFAEPDDRRVRSTASWFLVAALIGLLVGAAVVGFLVLGGDDEATETTEEGAAEASDADPTDADPIDAPDEAEVESLDDVDEPDVDDEPLAPQTGDDGCCGPPGALEACLTDAPPPRALERIALELADAARIDRVDDVCRTGSTVTFVVVIGGRYSVGRIPLRGDEPDYDLRRAADVDLDAEEFALFLAGATEAELFFEVVPFDGDDDEIVELIVTTAELD